MLRISLTFKYISQSIQDELDDFKKVVNQVYEWVHVFCIPRV